MDQVPFHELAARLASFGQSHVLRFWDALAESQQAELVNQIQDLDLPLLARLHGELEDQSDWDAIAARAQPPTAVRLHDSGKRFDPTAARAAAEQHLRDGKVGAVLVAGGQGTRLGFPHPKGMYEIGPVSRRSLFQMHVEQLRAVAARYGTRIPLFLMTSPATHEETVEYFAAHDRFGLPADDLHIFCQGTMPALDGDGKLLLEDKGRVFLSPDGHGGMLAALDRSGGLDIARKRGIEQLFYFQVDNPLVSICDRALIGNHLLAESEMTTLVVNKPDPWEKVGNVVSLDGRLQVIEYSDLPESAAQRREPDGSLTFWAGSIAVHVFQVDFLRRQAQHGEKLPFHRAHKAVPFIDDRGERVSPTEPNAMKFEQFIFDLMPRARNAIVVEGASCDVFAPLKNASGADRDTPESARQAIVDRARRWLESAGLQVAQGAVVEISPFLALEPVDLPGRLRGTRILSDTYLT
jgi:UDP-N-acetylglucosamine/UDP-N-acetylgalactosamine diphosphorylase